MDGTESENGDILSSIIEYFFNLPTWAIIIIIIGTASSFATVLIFGGKFIAKSFMEKRFNDFITSREHFLNDLKTKTENLLLSVEHIQLAQLLSINLGDIDPQVYRLLSFEYYKIEQIRKEERKPIEHFISGLFCLCHCYITDTWDDIEHAKEDLNLAIKGFSHNSPDDLLGEAWNYLGVSHDRKGEYLRAINAYNNAMDKFSSEPKRKKVRYNLACTYSDIIKDLIQNSDSESFNRYNAYFSKESQPFESNGKLIKYLEDTAYHFLEDALENHESNFRDLLNDKDLKILSTLDSKVVLNQRETHRFIYLLERFGKTYYGCNNYMTILAS